MRWLLGEHGAGRVDFVLRGAGVLVVAGVLAGGGSYVVGGGGGGGGDQAHLWVDTDSGSCTRSSSVVEYDTATACGSFSAAYTAASGGDTIRVKTGTYQGQQSTGGSKTPTINVIGEDGVVVNTTHDTSLHGFSMAGNVTVSNVDVGGDMPFVYLGGDNSTWRDSTLLESCSSNTCARGITGVNTPEPILIYTDEEADTIHDAALINLEIEPQHVCTPGQGSCGSGDVYHLESVRIDQYVEGVIIDSVNFQSGGDDNTANVFITSPSSTVVPTEIVIRNSFFGSNGGSYNIDGGANGVCVDWVFAYNTFSQETLLSCTSGSNVTYIGNLGPKSTFCGTPGVTWTKNMWQWSSDPRCGGSTDSWEAGSNFGTDALEFDSTGHLEAGSPAIDAAETPGASDYCTGDLGSVDRDGDTRPAGSVCDVGADER